MNEVKLIDRSPEGREFLKDVRHGLGSEPKVLDCKYFYDKKGSELFDAITALPEYYPTRTEAAIMKEHAADMAAVIGRNCLLIEMGSGSSMKTFLLLDHLKDPAGYVPVDISGEHLHESAVKINSHYSDLKVIPVCADFHDEFAIPDTDRKHDHRVVYFPGSTIGNFAPAEAVALLENFASICGTGGGLLIGYDMNADREKLIAAYNDSEGVTAEFNLNLLERINHELGGDFKTEHFKHDAVFNEEKSRIEMYLVSLSEQKVLIDSEPFYFKEGERILTEYSSKYPGESFDRIAEQAGFQSVKKWHDANRLFCVEYFEAG